MYFIVVGTGRCGTTLLTEMLNLHPALFVMRESHWIPKLFEHFGLGPAPVDELIGIVLRTTHVTRDRVIECDEPTLVSWFPDSGSMRVAEFCDRIGAGFAHRSGKQYWADKTPDYGPYMGMLQLLWPECRFIHLIRNGADVAVSMSSHQGFQWLATAREMWWPPVAFNEYHCTVRATPRPLGEFAVLWERRLRRIRDESRRLRPGSLIEIRFEALVERPGDTLQELCRFVGLPAPDSWVQQASSRVDRQRLASRPAPEPGDMGEGPRALMKELGYSLP